MQPILARFFDISHTVAAMCSAGIALFVIGVVAAKNEIAEARGLDKIVALSHLCFADPAGGLRRTPSLRRAIRGNLVPLYMPWRIVLGIFRRLRVDRRVLEHRHQNWGALVRPAVRNHDVFVCRDDPFSRSAAPPAQQNYLGDRLPRDVVRRRRLDSCGNCNGRMARARQEPADHCGPCIDHDGPHLFWH